MCEIIDPIGKYEEPTNAMVKGETTLIIPFFEEDDIIFDDIFYEKGAKLYCEHPDTDWEEIEVPKGKALKCPALTNLKIVLPEPLEIS